MQPIIEKILGNNSLLANAYIKDSINLTKSIVIKNHMEGNGYNEYITVKYPKHVINAADKTTWRYYKHLSGQYHELDQQITLISLDSGSLFSLTKSEINLHKKTRKELLKFSLFYKELINKYPEQELYVKAIIDYNKSTIIDDIVNLPDYSIVSYDSTHIEENENDLIFQLEQAIDNYKGIRLIPYYSLSDNLFLASQYHILYNFILTKILGIRLKNAKTFKAHTYHIKNYLASHHFLDQHYIYLTKKQSLFLYRNLLYLDNRSGGNKIFNILIEKLFTDSNISIVNYKYKQVNSTDNLNYINYKFNEVLLNKANLMSSAANYTLDNIKEKEFALTNGNPKELTYGLSKINKKFKNSLFNTLLTKDLETIIIDNTDTVKYKLIPTIINYWAALLKKNKFNFLVTLVDPASNRELLLSAADLFKLFVIVLYKANNVTLTEFPVYYIENVFKDVLPSTAELLNMCYKPKYWYGKTIDDIKANIPSYQYITTSTQYEQYLTSVYNLNMGLWLFLTNLSDKDTNAQFELIVDRLNTSERYNFGTETISDFLTRLSFNNIWGYDKSSLDLLLYSMINNIYDNKLDSINRLKLIQQSLTEIFKKFNSYTTQFISNYYGSSPILAGHKDTRSTTLKNAQTDFYNYNQSLLNAEMNYTVRVSDRVDFIDNSFHNYKYKGISTISILSTFKTDSRYINNVNVCFNNKVVNDLGVYNWVINRPSTSQLEFLALKF